ncbi:hypothetical protein [Litorihabitans aurantiacus]|uniref:Uncharacterized protein n=1 Tax=Litorihabitans aurantiacus TaxID=1930061 RepID=A0AA37XH96_9MICO|nr:hypothetical protein [Litorihabitans aurantiacus]GMA33029.1 hypothetical protein GCM10025875_30210 [Litorihabitans aurantiacus]
MDIPSMIMGAAIASILWIVYYPSTKLKRLKQLEEEAARPDGASPPDAAP